MSFHQKSKKYRHHFWKKVSINRKISRFLGLVHDAFIFSLHILSSAMPKPWCVVRVTIQEYIYAFHGL